MSQGTTSASGPGECAPSSCMLRYSAGLARLDQSVRISTQERAGMRPWRSSHRCTKSTVSRKSGLSRASAEQSMTQALAMKASIGMVSTVLSGWSLPVIQCTGASKCVPVCSEQEKLFQYQPGPRSS